MQDRVQQPIAADGAAAEGHPHECAAHTASLATARGAKTLIGARGVELRRDGRAILQAIDLDINGGEIVTLIGPNGAGKTTLVRILLGLLRPDRGDIWRKDGLVIGYAPQRFDVDPAIPITVARFVGLGRASAQRADIERVLAEVGAAKLDERQLSELSGGELQRVILARALVREPHLLVLDEPVRGVDYAGEAELYALIGTLRSAHGLGVLLVSHDLHVVMAQSDRVICLNRHICCSGVPQSVARDPEYARLFGPQSAWAFGLYQHQHDHRHDLAGEPEPMGQAGMRRGPRGHG